MSIAWVTLAPRSMAILVAAPIWPCSEPMMRRRMIQFPSDSDLGLTGFDDFRHGDAQAVFHENDLAARHETIVDVDVYRFADLAIELDDRSLAKLQQLAHFHARFPEHGDGDRHVEHRFEI